MVVVPTHDHASTLPLAVRSALEQTVADLDVVVIGDGVGDDTRGVMAELCRADGRVRFVDRTKGSGRNEAARHEVVSAASAPAVTYLGDDDLLLPGHVETMLGLLAEHDFAHPFPIVIGVDGDLVAYPTDLSDERCVAWHRYPNRNTVSLTGAAHKMELYRRLPAGWRPAPPGRWSDHFMWEQIFSVPGVRLVTGRRATTIKQPADARPGMNATARRAELVRWWERMHEPGFVEWWDAAVDDAVWRVAVGRYRDSFDLADALQREEERRRAAELSIAATEQSIAAKDADHVRIVAERDALQQRLCLIEGTRTWRVRELLIRTPVVRRLMTGRRSGWNA
jgi:glycosyltransferase involved in cell wall biosynthesis